MKSKTLKYAAFTLILWVLAFGVRWLIYKWLGRDWNWVEGAVLASVNAVILIPCFFLIRRYARERAGNGLPEREPIKWK